MESKPIKEQSGNRVITPPDEPNTALTQDAKRDATGNAIWNATWDERYRTGQAAPKIPCEILKRAADLLPPSLAPRLALDLACGTGRHTLWLATQGWQVRAVDFSTVALQQLQEHAVCAGVSSQIETHCSELEKHEFSIEPATYDLVVKTCYLQRDLFQAVVAGLRPGGLLVALIALADDDSLVRPMNVRFLLQQGELPLLVKPCEIVHYAEPKAGPGQRRMAELIARRP